ncbi:MAG: TolB family protein [Saprospiraceae bacterium]
MKLLKYLPLLFIILISCNKDDDFIDNCEEIGIPLDAPPCSNCPYYRVEGMSYRFPNFNPNNPNEFIYYSVKDSSSGIIKHNIETGINEFLTKDLRFQGRPKWSKKDWIIFPLRGDGPTFDIWKIKSNGDSLTQLTFTGQCHYPEWNLNGDKFIYKVGYTSPTISIIADEFGNTLDTLLGGSQISWTHDSLLVFSGPAGVGYFSLNTKKHHYIQLYHNVSDYVGNSQSAIWINDKEMIWTTNKGIFKIHRETEQANLIRETCDSHYYIEPSYSPISDKLLLVKLNQRMEGYFTIVQNFELVIMNTDGSGEEVIELPH